MASRTLIVSLLLVTVPLMATVPAGAHGGSNVVLDDEKIVEGDTYLFSVTTTNGLRLSGASFVHVTGFFQPGERQQDQGSLVGVFRGTGEMDCAVGNGSNPCYMQRLSSSNKDLDDVHVTTPDTPPVHQETDRSYDTSHAATIGWSTGADLEVPNGASSATYRFFATFPGADFLRVHIHFHGPQPVTVAAETDYDGGFFRSGEDFKGGIQADTAVANAQMYRWTNVRQDPASPTHHLFASAGLGSNGDILTPNPLTGDACGLCPTRTTSLATGSYGVEYPNGNSQAAYFAGAADVGAPFGADGPPPGSNIRVTGSTQTGVFSFFTNEYVGAGAQDIYVVGFSGPLP